MSLKRHRVKSCDKENHGVNDEQQAFQLEIRRAGLARLLEAHQVELEKARVSAEQLVSSIPRGLHMYDEPAHVFRAMQRAKHD